MTMSAHPAALAGKIAVIGGGSGGIGAAAAGLLAEAGATIVVGYHRNAAKAAAVAAAIPGSGHIALPTLMDDSAALNGLAGDIRDRFGRLDILVNSAGMTRPVPHNDLDNLTDEIIDEVFRVNWRGPFAMIRAMQPLLQASGVGSSIAYCGAKAVLACATLLTFSTRSIIEVEGRRHL